MSRARKFEGEAGLASRATGHLSRILPDPLVCRLTFAVLAGFVLAALPAVAQVPPPNDNFSAAQVITGPSGSLTANNANATKEFGEPAHGGNAGGASIWYHWTAPADGNIVFDTEGSTIDTLLAVYKGSSVTNLTLVAQNDDVNLQLGDLTSRVAFPAVGGTDYFVAVDGYNFGLGAAQGPVVLSWNSPAVASTNLPSGEFRLATDSAGGRRNLYVFSERESSAPLDPNRTLLPSVPARLTVTRTGGTHGRCTVDYVVTNSFYTNVFTTNVFGTNILTSTTPGGGFTNIFITNIVITNIYQDYNWALAPQFHYFTNVFAFQIGVTNDNGIITSNRSIIPPPTNWVCLNLNSTTNILNTNTTPTTTTTIQSNLFCRPPATATDIIPSAVPNAEYTPQSGTLTFDDFDMSQDIFVPVFATSGPDVSRYGNPNVPHVNRLLYVTITNAQLDALESTEVQPPTTSPTLSRAAINILENDLPENGRDAYPSNAIINLERATFRCREGIGVIHMYALRSGTNRAAATITWRTPPAGNPPGDFPEPQDHTFPLQPGSDYTTPGEDFIAASGTLSWGADDFTPKPFDITISNDTIVEFNEDLDVQLFQPSPGNNSAERGLVHNANLTILFDDYLGGEQPAGAVDRTHNKNDASDSVPAYIARPGANNTVMALAVQPDGKTLIAGDFSGFDTRPHARIARLNPNGYDDTTFLPPINNVGQGANNFISALTLQGDGKILCAGEFTAMLGQTRNRIARLQSGGALDTAFNPGLGPDNTIWAIALQSDGKIVIAGDFTNVANNVRQHIARLDTNGAVDLTFDAGIGPNGTINAIALDSGGNIIIGGEFNQVAGQLRNGIARLTSSGALDTTFNVGAGANGNVFALALQGGTRIMVGGDFTQVDGRDRHGIARLNADGSLDTTFDPGDGFDDTVYSIAPQADGTIFVGGRFESYNGTRRVGLARIYADGPLDTGFMDTAYNHFAGLPNHYHDPNVINTDLYPITNLRNFIFGIGVESGGNVLIGGGFWVVGGGYTRDDVLPRGNIARLVGGSTPGPGNIQVFPSDYYRVDENGGGLYISLERTNGNLGIAQATIGVNLFPAGPGAATANDFVGPTPILPTWNSTWVNTQRHSDAQDGPNFLLTPAASDVTVLINNNTNIDGNRTAELQLTQPNGTDLLFLGGENIPFGVALGTRQSTMTIVDDDSNPGVLGFSSATYTVSEGVGQATIDVIRTNGSAGPVTVQYATISGGTATSGLDYSNRTGTLSFNAGQTSKSFSVPIVDDASIEVDETILLRLFNPGNGATLGLSNAVLTIVDNDFPAGRLNFSSATFSTNENAGVALVTVTRTGGAAGALTVQFATSDGTATAGSDYIGVTNTVSWTNNDVTPKVVAIPLLDDNNIEADETVNLRIYASTLNGTTNLQALGGLTNATLTLVNDDFRGSVQFSTANYSVNENGGPGYITVVRTGGSAESISVNFSATNGTATAGFDFTATNGTLTFGPGEVSKTFTVSITDNLFQDGNRFISLSLANPTPAGTLGVTTNAVLTIVDDESTAEPAGSLDSSYDPLAGFNGAVNALALQSDGKLIVGGAFTQANGLTRNSIARLNPNGDLDNKFSFALTTSGCDSAVRALVQQTDGRIVIGGDFQHVDSAPRGHIARLNLSGTLNETFDTGNGTDNPVFSVAETFVSGQRKILIGGSFTVVDSHNHSGIAQLNEDGTVDGTFNPSLVNGIVYAIAVQADGRVLIGGDFTGVNGAVRNRIARLLPNGDLDLSFDPAAGADDAVRAIAVQSDGRIVIGGSFTNYHGTPLTRFARLNSNGSVDATFTPGAGANDTVNAIVILPDTRIILGGQFTRCSGVTRNHLTRLNNDGTVDPGINFGAGANNFVSSVVVQPDGKFIIGGGFTEYDGTPRQRIARIYGGAISGSGTLEFTSANYFVNEAGTNATITVRRRGGTAGQPAPNNITVDAVTYDGTATNGIHYQGGTSTLVFPPGEVFQTFLLPVIDNFEINPDRTVSLVLTNIQPSGSAALGNQPTATLNIINDDSAIVFSSGAYSRNETSVDGMATITINRLGSTTGTSTVDFMTTTNGTATPFVDYTPVTNSLVFAPGETTKTVTVPIIPDTLVEGDETVSLQLDNVGGAFLLTPSQATLTIVDDDFAPGRIGFVAPAFFVSESAGSVDITLIRTNGRTGAVSVDYYTSDATANAGLDYTAKSGSVSFNNNETVKTITIPITSDTLVEGPEYFNLTLTNVQGGASLIDPTNVPVNIVDDDVGITFSSPVYLVGEGGGAVTITVLRINGSNGVATVNYTTTNGTATAGSDYVATSGTLTFNNGETLKTFTIPVLEDTLVEGDETFNVVLSKPATNAQSYVLVNSSSIVTILDNDSGLGFAPADYVVDESGTNVVLTVVRTNGNTGTITCSYGTTNGTATAGADYAAASGQLVFTNGELVKTITIPIFDDTQVEGDENFTVTLSNPTGGAQFTGPTTANVTIVDNDAGLRFSSGSYLVLESGVSATITVLRTNITNSVVSVDYATADGTATNGQDYIGVSGTLVFTNGETSKTFTVPIIDDTLVEGNETVLLKLFNVVGQASLLSPNAATLTIVDNDGSAIVPAGVLLTSESGPVNGAIDPGETVTALFALRNISGLDTANLTATLLATNGVTNIVGGAQNYGALVSGGASVSRPFTFKANATNGGVVSATFHLSDGALNFGTATFNFLVGTASGTFSNTAAIIINDATNSAPAPATPYPSAIPVAGLVGAVSHVSVTLSNAAHTNPDDIDILLAGPAGQRMVLMSDCGGGNVITNVTLTFDDSAGATLPDSGQIVSGTNKPTNYLIGDSFPSPAPPLPFDSTLATFNGSNPNGAWSLFVVDDATLDVGQIKNGWSLTITTAGTVPASADLSVTMIDTPDPAIATSNLVYTVLVTNHGPWAATGVTLTNTLPGNAAYVSSSSATGTIATNGAGLLTWTIGAMAKDAVASATITVRPTSAGVISSTSSAFGAESDPNVANNTAVADTTISTPTADLVMAIVDSPDPVFLGGNLTYSLYVTNSGPATATGVAITNTLPSGVSFVSASPSAYSVAGSVVTFTNLGSFGAGSVASASIIVHPNAVATLTNTATAGSAVTDPLKGNNTASVKTLVEYPAMTATLAGNNLVIAWPADANNYNLESTTSLTPPVTWSPVSSPSPLLVNGQKVITLPIGAGSKYFHLRAALP